MALITTSNIDLHFDSSEKTKGKFLVLDTETTGLIQKNKPGNDHHELPRILQFAWLLFDSQGKLIKSHNRIIHQSQPVPATSTRIHGIDDTVIQQNGEPPHEVWSDFLMDLENCDYLVGHNIDFDIQVIEGELRRQKINNPFAGKRMICTMKEGKNHCRIPSDDGNGFRYPELEELYKIVFWGRLTGPPITGLHDAFVDASVTAKIFLKMLKEGDIKLTDASLEPFILPLGPGQGAIVKSRFFVNIILPTFITITLLLLTIFLIIIPRFRDNIMLGKRQMIQELTNAAVSILENYEKDEKNGLISRDLAQKVAMSRIQYIRYGEENKDYFWITDMTPVMVMHPYRRDLEGESLRDFTDPRGKRLFVEMVQVATQNGKGYVDYMWQWKDDTAHIVPKLSFVKEFKPWGWIIGTGIYIEDVKKEIRLLTQRLLIITLGIAVIIALLLTYITIQSMKIEKKRKNAESLLQISKEKYKTLVDATTEGLIMIVDRKMIFTNNKVHELTGFSEDELLNQSFQFLLSSKNSLSAQKIIHNEKLPDGQFELLLTSKSGSDIEALISVASIIFYEQEGKLVTIKNTSIQKHPEGTAEDIAHLMDAADLGLIRILPDEKARILYAGPFVIKLFGFINQKEPLQHGLLDFFIDPDEKKSFKKLLLTEGKVKNVSFKIKRTDGTIIIVAISMILVKSETGQMLGEGILTDITRQAHELEETTSIISSLEAHSHLLRNGLSDYLQPAVEVTFNTPVITVIERIKKSRSNAILITDGQEANMGIVTLNDIITRVLLTDRDFQKPAWQVMSAPVATTDADTTIFQALTRMKDQAISHLVIRNSSGVILGLIQKKDLMEAMVNSKAVYENRIGIAQNKYEITMIFQEFRKYLQTIIKQHADPVIVGKTMASLSDSITVRLIDLACEQMGEPPVDFAFIALGSEGRMEQTLATDQDNAIIFSEIPDKDSGSVQAWFNKLGEIVCNDLNTIGFRFCKGRIMAKNPMWCKPLPTWKHYFSEWITNTEPKNLMDVSIFFDLRTIYGNHRLTEELRTHIDKISDGNGSFFYNLTENIRMFRSPLGITGSIHAEKRDEKDYFNLKNALAPFVMFARIYSIHHKLSLSNTAGRLKALQALQVLTGSNFDEIMFGYNFLMQQRYRHQVSRLEKGEEVDNSLALQDLTELEETILKKILTQSADLLNKLNIDFKSTVL
jgi:PAS domain S-box-containing protein